MPDDVLPFLRDETDFRDGAVARRDGAFDLPAKVRLRLGDVVEERPRNRVVAASGESRDRKQKRHLPGNARSETVHAGFLLMSPEGVGALVYSGKTKCPRLGRADGPPFADQVGKIRVRQST